MQEIFQNDTWQIDVAESDKDPDFIPQTKKSTMKMTRNIFCQGLSPTRPLRVSLRTKAIRMYSIQRKLLSPYTQEGNRERKTLSERIMVKAEKQRKKREEYQRIKPGCLGHETGTQKVTTSLWMTIELT
ncbi:hypothetical protein RRG08_019485 [Elysia crispata]|uniref:Uncharacterized protein n=1 Tax=Elysia crispata TaxID=231223 RepID=A0AAE1CZ00_9GAST|nr:hypothetical protein RRG08_019485 [Elysia crispata]